MASRGNRAAGTRRRTEGSARLLPALAAVVVLSAACGSTVAPGAGGQAAGTAPGGAAAVGQDPTLSVPGAPNAGPAAAVEGGIVAPGAPGGGGPAAPGGGPAAGAGPAPADGSAPLGTPNGSTTTGPRAAQPGGMPVTGRGYDAKTILIGFGTQEDAKENSKKLGADVSTGSQKRQAEAIVNDINSRGGILGRKIKLVFHDLRTADYNSNRAGAQQAACETWTRDNQVFAAVSGTGSIQYGDSPIYECLAKQDTPLLFVDNVPREQRLYERYPSTLYTPGTATVDRFGPGLISSLADQKYFSPWDTRAGARGVAPVKVGVLHTTDEPGLPAIYQRALEAAGQRDVLFFQLNGKTTQDYSAAIGAAVLKFSSEGVTHVLTNGSLTYFAPAAYAQGYRPRMGVTSWDALAVAVQVVRPESLAGAMGAGFLPHLDVDQANAPKDVSPEEVRCRKIMEGAGQAVSSRTTMYSMLTICEDFWLIEGALKRAGAISTQAMRAGVESQVKPLVGGVSFAMRYGPRQHDGAHAVRSLTYSNGGFRYTSGNRPLR